ncbi:MAG: hypothetical protein DHS20C11_20380 [Lysobacteraceae bacterium]|nr:MAG: hypothetical protein DHS20C11_20380 [Xanthomonadaceae bacterium]
MAIAFFPQFFSSLSEVLDDVKANDTWPTTFVSGPSDGLHVHWHADEVHAYIVEGETDFLDTESGKRTAVKAGHKVVVPAKTPHAEGAVKDRVVYILALPGPRSPEAFLAMHDPNELKT